MNKNFYFTLTTLLFIFAAFQVTANAFAIPKAPANLVAKVVSATQINLTWQDAATDESSFELERSLNGTTFTKLSDLAANTVQYQNTGLTGSTKYWYRIRAKNASGTSAYSNIASATTSAVITIPKAPTTLTASPASGYQINLTWKDQATDETAFELERSVDGLAFTKLGDLPANTVAYQDKGLLPATKYWYRILAKNTAGKSAYSNIATATTAQIPPAAPGNLAATAISQTQIDVSWSDQSNNETSFELQRSADGNTFTRLIDLPANTTKYQNTALTAATTYYYRVRAVNAAGTSAYSAVASARTLNVPVPNAPVNFTAVPLAPGLIQLRWAAVTGGATKVTVERSKGAPDAFAALATLPGNATQFADTMNIEKSDYYYRIKASNAGGDSPYSEIGIVRASSIITSVPQGSARVFVSGKTLILENVAGGSALRIFNAGGTALISRTLGSAERIDLSTWAAGIYIVRVESGSAVLTRKIVLY